MANIEKNIEIIDKSLPKNVEFVVVTKHRELFECESVYNCGKRIFGENRPQELCRKYELLPKDIQWHLIGTLQSNKAKYIVPFVSLIHSIDSAKLLEVVNKEAIKCNRCVDVLMEVFVATESTKHGWLPSELLGYMRSEELASMSNIRIRGIMGMASFTNDTEQVRSEFRVLKELFDTIKQGRGEEFDTLSMGMSGDYPIAIEEGATMVRIGSAVFE